QLTKRALLTYELLPRITGVLLISGHHGLLYTSPQTNAIIRQMQVYASETLLR
ncbi:hypothetical protein KI387_000442, partial [Taxus chinensis]